MTKRVAVVTGGIGGLGTAICKRLAHDGRQVIAADLGSRQDRLAAFREETKEYDGSIVFAPVDVASYDACADLVTHVADTWGSVDIVVNAAGITRDTSLKKMSPDQWSELMNVDLDSVFNMCRNVVDGMSGRGFGRIVNISSVNGQTGQFGQTNYSAAKAGMHGFTMALAREVAKKGVTVNSVSPGYCATEMVMKVPEDIRAQIVAQIPVGRLGEPSEIARTVAFLTADDAGFITGANIPVNGGYFMSF
ncbi:MAG TPA: acetoacetyl-CoA reductase [Rhodanobacteraceae bacterium]|jgi:acetoacetyl-CoA reductase|nr:acetoacetyl-CoA reductase [Rhodanobacteraceae bacterium]